MGNKITQQSSLIPERCTTCETVELNIKPICFVCRGELNTSLDYYKTFGNFCRTCISEINANAVYNYPEKDHYSYKKILERNHGGSTKVKPSSDNGAEEYHCCHLEQEEDWECDIQMHRNGRRRNYEANQQHT